MAVNFANGGEQKYSSNIVNMSHFTDATRNISVSNNNGAFPIEFDFTKLAADTSIVLWGYTPVAIQNSYQTGVVCQINDVSNFSDYTRYFDACHFISPHASAGANGNYTSIHWSMCWNSSDTGIDSAGSKRVRLGWETRDGSTNNSPTNRWNPDKQSDRIRERTTQITVMEVYANINRFT